MSTDEPTPGPWKVVDNDPAMTKKHLRLQGLVVAHDETDCSDRASEHEAIHDAIYVLLGKNSSVDEEHAAIAKARGERA